MNSWINRKMHGKGAGRMHKKDERRKRGKEMEVGREMGKEREVMREG